MTSDPIWDELFHGVIWAAFVQVARETQGWPDSEAVRRRAYAMYEAELKERNAAKNLAHDGELLPP